MKLKKLLLPIGNLVLLSSTIIPAVTSCAIGSGGDTPEPVPPTPGPDITDISVIGKIEITSYTNGNIYTACTNPAGKTDNLQWSIKNDSCKIAPTFDGSATGKSVAIQANSAGTFNLVAVDPETGTTGALAITIIDPFEKSNKIWFQQTNQNAASWWSIEKWDTENISVKQFGASKSVYLSVESFNAPLYFGEYMDGVADDFLMGCINFKSPIVFNDSFKYIGANFLRGCSLFNQELILPESLISIGDGFLQDCTNFNNGDTQGSQNKPLEFKNNYIGANCLRNCTSLNNDVSIAKTVKNIGSSFMFNCINMNSTITINASCSILDCATSTPLTFAAEKNAEIVWRTNGLAIVVLTADDKTLLEKNFKEMVADADPFYRHLNIKTQ